MRSSEAETCFSMAVRDSRDESKFVVLDAMSDSEMVVLVAVGELIVSAESEQQEEDEMTPKAIFFCFMLISTNCSLQSFIESCDAT